ncbi:hypothetical protein, partial [Flagellimonas sp. S3867]|uniref:hypothetical protein n=1 Tax=Flagellimonas sp. S3867 TaxID=2768063 RepID=UPI00168695EB
MIKFLPSHPTCYPRAKIELNQHTLKRILQISPVLLLLFSSIGTFGQEIDVDTWFRADKAVNADPAAFSFWQPEPGVPGTFGVPGGDGTSVIRWYDIVDFTSQDAIEHPVPADYPLDWTLGGFDYPFGAPGFLTPTGTIPDVPVFRRNPTDNINFNPVVQFDGSGDGQALHFRSHSRDSITLFIVFKALGAGNSAETQRLLFGGDISVHHSSTTNLSLGISNGNRFSIGRTWLNDFGGYFQSGGIDLLGEPTIGVFSREYDFRPMTLNPFETLTTYVNGIEDISVQRDHSRADNGLHIFNRLGKHFNSSLSNRNLSGDIAEILLADGLLTDNHRRRVESYLAIKYGVTLFDGNQLGSIVGNDSYNYLAADGTIIWQSEPTYKHDIAGIGVDRYQDGGTIELRYIIDQRISKSVNSDAIVTMSTNTDFSTDNLDLTRTRIDGDRFSYDHNYLLWANDDASINQTNVELPPTLLVINSRIAREWRVQKTTSAGRTPISGVSVRVDLSGSNIAKVACALKLLIDIDGDGDFTTGDITMIDATSVDGFGNVYFDDITFLHNEVFTIGFGDTTPDITSNPGNQDVCDEYVLPNIVGTNLTGNEAYYDASGGPTGGGNQYAPGDVITASGTYYIYDTTGAPLNCFDEEFFTVNIDISPIVNAGSDEEICATEIFDLGLSSIVPTANNHSSILWNTSGDGGFNNPILFDPFYTPGPNDIVNGSVTLTLTANGNGSCPATNDDMILTINSTPLADAGSGGDVCDIANAFVTSASASNGTGTWTNQTPMVGNAT